MRGEKHDAVECLKNSGMLPEGFVQHGRGRFDPRRCAIQSAENLTARCYYYVVVFTRELNPDARIRPVMNEIIHEPRMPSKRNAFARGTNVSLGRGCILLVAEMVADVRQ